MSDEDRSGVVPAVPDVSRETPSWPAMAERVFPRDRLSLAAAYAAALADAGVVRGLIGPREVPRLWERHLVNSAVIAEAVAPGTTVCDVGSGAGLPGVVLAIARPDLQVTLLEPLLRRTTFLSEVVLDLGLDNVEVLRGRAEELHGRRSFDVVTSRAVAPLGRLLGWCMPLVSPRGCVLAMKGSSAAAEIEEARAVWSRMGCAEPEVVIVGGSTSADVAAADVAEQEVAEAGSTSSTGTLVRVAWADPGRVSSRSASGQSPRARRPHPSPGNRKKRS